MRQTITQNNRDALSRLCDDAWQLMATWLALPELARLIVACTWTHDQFNDDKVVWKMMFRRLQKANVSTELFGSVKDYKSEGVYYKSQCERVVRELLLHKSFYANDLKLKKGKISLDEAREFRNSVLVVRNNLSQIGQNPSAFLKSFFLFAIGLGGIMGRETGGVYTGIVSKLSKQHGRVSISMGDRGLVGKYIMIFRTFHTRELPSSAKRFVKFLSVKFYFFCGAFIKEDKGIKGPNNIDENDPVLKTVDKILGEHAEIFNMKFPQ